MQYIGFFNFFISKFEKKSKETGRKKREESHCISSLINEVIPLYQIVEKIKIQEINKRATFTSTV